MNKNMNTSFTDLKNTWKNLGETDIFWSVLTNSQYSKNNLNKNSIIEFYESGRKECIYLEKLLNIYGYSFKNKNILDFGCGVGRVLKAFAEVSNNIYGMDISIPHLKIAQRFVPSGKFYVVDNYHSLPILDNQIDIIYSLITLQHNRPRLMKQYIHLLLQLLNPNGIALLHIPYYIPNYQFNEDKYNGNIQMEMHCISKEEVNKIIIEEKCKLLGEDPRDICGGGILNTTYVIQKLKYVIV